MNIVGYSDHFSIKPNQTMRFMVSSRSPSYQATLVRLRHTDRNPAGPGFKTELVESSFAGGYCGFEQDIYTGSYVEVLPHKSMALSSGFTVEAWIYPTTPDKGVQGLLTCFSGSCGYGLVIDEDGSVSLWLGDGQTIHKVRTDTPLLPSHWYFLRGCYDSVSGKASVHQCLASKWPIPGKDISVTRDMPARLVCTEESSFLMASSRHGLEPTDRPGYHFNGKIDSPKLFSKAFLPREDVESIALVADWDLSLDVATAKINDIGPGQLHGRAINLPTRSVTSHNWTGKVSAMHAGRSQYSAIYFHDDDLEDAGWNVAFEWTVPEDLNSGIYAVHLVVDDDEDYVPFVVTPTKPRASIAFLAPTLSYLIYANQRFIDPIRASLDLKESDEITPQDAYMRDRRLLSCYDLHSDGSGVCYSSRLRPVLNFRPGYVMPSRSLAAFSPRHLNADLHLLDWLDQKQFAYDVISDDDLNRDGVSVLEEYRVILTGSHPEYWTESMLCGLETYQTNGGRLMYLGGNGFYWVTTLDAERPHVAEVRRWGGTRVWEAAPGECYHSTTGELGGLWRNRGRPPQKMVGVGFTSQGSGRNQSYRRLQDSFNPRVKFIFDGVPSDEMIGDFPALVLGHGAAGFEIDRVDTALGTPKHALRLASADGFSDRYQLAIEDQLVSSPNTGGSQSLAVRSDMVYFEGPCGGAVFSVGSISWCSCLSYNHYTNNVSRITENVLRHFARDDAVGDRDE